MSKPILLDGPMGTEIDRRGGNTSLPLWSARALMEMPDLVKEIHLDFINHGAQVITTNTFRTQERTLKRAGYEGKGEILTKLAVQLANEAAIGSPAKVAGSISPLEDCYSPQLVPTSSELTREHGLMAKWLYDRGIDLFLIETMNLIREAKEAVKVVKEYDIPIWLGFTCDDNGKILGGDAWKDVVQFFGDKVDMIIVNCSAPKASMIAFEELYRYKQEFEIKIGIYPNYLFDLEKGRSILDIRNDFIGFFDKIIEMKPDLIGTCCGAIPEDTKILSDKIHRL